MSQVYKISLKPIDTFYFGGENSFTSAKLEQVVKEDKEAQDYFKKRQGYFAKSEMFPQQTQLLGMIRKELLRINKKLIYFKNFVRVPTIYKDSATKIVGDTKWKASNKIKLGDILRLSPLYLENKKSIFFPLPVDFGWELEKTGCGYVNGLEKKKAYALKRGKDIYFGAKNYLESRYISEDGKEILDLSDIFAEQIQTHNQTLIYKDDDEGQLFKVKRYSLDKDFRFVTYLTMKDDRFLDEIQTTVSLGGERTYFVMDVKKIKEKDTPSFENYKNICKSNSIRIVLLSDTYIEYKDDIFTRCEVVFAKKRILRTIEDNKGEAFKKTQKKVLFEKGTVFYPKEAELGTVEGIIKKYENFRKIGYNQYKILTKKGENR